MLRGRLAWPGGPVRALWWQPGARQWPKTGAARLLLRRLRAIRGCTRMASVCPPGSSLHRLARDRRGV